MTQLETITYRLIRRARRDVQSTIARVRDRFFTSYGAVKDSGNSISRQFSFVDSKFVDSISREFPVFPNLLIKQAEAALVHEFNLLGSGPVVVKHGMKCQGLNQNLYASIETSNKKGLEISPGSRVNEVNRSRAEEIGRLISKGYTPIDWCLDFKSGYRWNESTWYQDIRIGNLVGVDVKVPWELSRMQHLPVLGLAACFARYGHEGFKSAAIYAEEFRNQVLDFMASNPPRFGVNWACTMDVAIRIANWLVAYDLVSGSGVQLGKDFDDFFVASVRSHARHIFANLEWAPIVRGNHYIANIVGLLFASIYLPDDVETNRWLSFSIQELIAEVEYQFHEDGSNFEGSVCYHRLSAEMVVWASTLVLNLLSVRQVKIKKFKKRVNTALPLTAAWLAKTADVPLKEGQELFPDWYWKRLTGMAMFTDAMTKANGLVAQIGDNDSGRFITLGSGEQMRAGNNPESPFWSLDHRGLISLIHRLVDKNLHVENILPDPATRLIGGILGNASHHIEVGNNWAHDLGAVQTNEEIWFDLMRRCKNTNSSSRFITSFEAQSHGLLEDIKFAAYSGMGVYIVKSPRLYMAVRCGEIGLVGLGGHAHCDQLGIELIIDGAVLAHDPGAFIYTPLPEQRNAYRSSMAHHVPRVPGREPADLTRGVFDLRDCGEGRCIYFGPRGFIGFHCGYGTPVYRIIELQEDGVVVYDFSEDGEKIADPTPVPLPYSQGYGQKMLSVN